MSELGVDLGLIFLYPLGTGGSLSLGPISRNPNGRQFGGLCSRQVQG